MRKVDGILGKKVGKDGYCSDNHAQKLINAQSSYRMLYATPNSHQR